MVTKSSLRYGERPELAAAKETRPSARQPRAPAHGLRPSSSSSSSTPSSSRPGTLCTALCSPASCQHPILLEVTWENLPSFIPVVVPAAPGLPEDEEGWLPPAEEWGHSRSTPGHHQDSRPVHFEWRWTPGSSWRLRAAGLCLLMSEAASFWGAVILTPGSHAVGSLPPPTPFFPAFLSVQVRNFLKLGYHLIIHCLQPTAVISHQSEPRAEEKWLKQGEGFGSAQNLDTSSVLS